MTSSHAIIGSALATAAANAIIALVIIFAIPSEAARTDPHTLTDSRPHFQLSPIPAGADWGRS
jgi:Na+-driven multidrug efflux pump